MQRYPDAFDKISKRCESSGFASLSKRDQIVYCVWWLESEVNNGGFHQFFLNSAGDFYLETLSALDCIGAQFTRRLLLSAADLVFSGKSPQGINRREYMLNELSEKLTGQLYELDKKFYAYQDNIEQLVNIYLTTHPV